MTIHFFQNRPKFRCIQLTAWKIGGLGLSWPESIYLIDPPELKPVGFVWMGCPPHRKSHVALGRRSKVSDLESPFVQGAFISLVLDAAKPRWSDHILASLLFSETFRLSF